MAEASFIRRIVDNLMARSSSAVAEGTARHDMLFAAIETRHRMRLLEDAKVPAAKAVCDLVHDLRWVFEQAYPRAVTVDFEASAIRVTPVVGRTYENLLKFSGDVTNFPLYVEYRDDCADAEELRAAAVAVLKDSNAMERIERMISSTADHVASRSSTFEDALEVFSKGETSRRVAENERLVRPHAKAAADELSRLAAHRSNGTVRVEFNDGRIEYRSSHAMMLLADLLGEQAFPIMFNSRVLGSGNDLALALRSAFAQQLQSGAFETFVREAAEPSF